MEHFIVFRVRIAPGIEGAAIYRGTLFLSEEKVITDVGEYTGYRIDHIIRYDNDNISTSSKLFSDELDQAKEKAHSLYKDDYKIIFLQQDDAIVYPEFFDFHEHGEFLTFTHKDLSPKREQNLRGGVLGNCGISPYPVVEGKEELLRQSVLSTLGPWPTKGNEKYTWTGLKDFMEVLKERNLQMHYKFLTGHAALRIAAIDGNPNREATNAEIKEMCRLLDKMFDEGSIGFSTGLYYTPCIFASRKELIALLKVVKKRKGLFAVHIREEGNRVLESLNEVIELSKEVGVRLQVSHLKAIGIRNQAKVKAMIGLIEKAYDDGLDIMFDQYPYTYGSTTMFALLPPQALSLPQKELNKCLADSDWREKCKKEMLNPKGWESIVELCGLDNIYVQSLGNTNEFDQMSIYEISRSLCKDPFDTLFDLLIESKGLAVMQDTTTNEDSLEIIFSHPLSIYASDSLYAGETWHPRSLDSTFEAIKFSERHNLEFQNTITRMTGRGAARVGLEKYFTIQVGSVVNLIDNYNHSIP